MTEQLQAFEQDLEEMDLHDSTRQLLHEFIDISKQALEKIGEFNLSSSLSTLNQHELNIQTMRSAINNMRTQITDLRTSVQILKNKKGDTHSASDDYVKMTELNTKNIASIFTQIDDLKGVTEKQNQAITSLTTLTETAMAQMQELTEQVSLYMKGRRNKADTRADPPPAAEKEILNDIVDTVSKLTDVVENTNAIKELKSKMILEKSPPATGRRESVEGNGVEQVSNEIEKVKQQVEQLIRTSKSEYADADMRTLLSDLQMEYNTFTEKVDQLVGQQRVLCEDVHMLTEITESIAQDAGLIEEVAHKDRKEPTPESTDNVDGIFPCISSRLDAVDRVLRDYRSRCVPSAI